MIEVEVTVKNGRTAIEVVGGAGVPASSAVCGVMNAAILGLLMCTDFDGVAVTIDAERPSEWAGWAAASENGRVE